MDTVVVLAGMVVIGLVVVPIAAILSITVAAIAILGLKMCWERLRQKGGRQC